MHALHYSSNSKFRLCCKCYKYFIFKGSIGTCVAVCSYLNRFPSLHIVQLCVWKWAVVQEWCLHFWHQWSDLQLYICEWLTQETSSVLLSNKYYSLNMRMCFTVAQIWTQQQRSAQQRRPPATECRCSLSSHPWWVLNFGCKLFRTMWSR